MTKDEIMELAKKAGFIAMLDEDNKTKIIVDYSDIKTLDECLTKFTELILASKPQPTPSQS